MAQVDPYSRSTDQFIEPPRSFAGTLKHLGPGMILVGSVVGSGELIMTTKLGAVAGFTLLWFVLLSCLIKVVVQAEIARHTISSGQTFLDVFNRLPGPAFNRPQWMTLPWLGTVVLASVASVTVFVQLDEARQSMGTGLLLSLIVVAACMVTALFESRRQQTSLPGKTPMTQAEPGGINWFTALWLVTALLTFVNSGAILGAAGQALQLGLPDVFGENGSRIWATVIAVVSTLLLLSGSYGSLEKTLIALVATFTLLTLVCTVALQWTGYAITPADISHGLSLMLPEDMDPDVLMVALAMYAGTGVAYGEMWTYTYWCVEKGYARNVGANDPGEAWPKRARGWIRVMYTDVLLTMAVYTVSTVCFYFLGAAVLFAEGKNPDGAETLSVLSGMYTGTLANWASTLFVVGAFFVLFSTVLSGAAGSARVLADCLGVIGLADRRDYPQRMKLIRVFVVVSLVLYTAAYWLFENPPKMLAITSSLIGALMYPVIGLGAIWLRYRDVDSRIAPGKTTTALLWICGIAVAVISPAGIVLAMLL